MAVSFCRFCGGRLNLETGACPHCIGPSKRPVRSWSPFRWLGFGALLVGAVGLAGAAAYARMSWLESRMQLGAATTKYIRTSGLEGSQTGNAPVHPNPKTLIQQVQPRVVFIEVSTRSAGATGSGFLFNGQGHVMTNAHVVKGAVKVTVRDAEGKDHPAQILGISQTDDVAVLSVPDLQGLEPLVSEQAAPPVQGDEVLAFGSPFGLQNTVTNGMISAVGRSVTVGDSRYEALLQISAPLNPGNSGGPLVSQQTGRVIGINTLAADPHVARAIGFAIPIQRAIEVAAAWSSRP